MLRVIVGTVGIGVAVNLVSAGVPLGIPWSIGLLVVLCAAIVYIERDKAPPARPTTDTQPPRPAPPAPPMRFVSPGSVMERLREALTGPAEQTRSVSLWGMSGIGKTTLARMVANESALFPGGVFWGDLRVERDPGPLLEDWLVRGGHPPGAESVGERAERMRQVLASRVAQGRVLLVLDDASVESAELLSYVERLLIPGTSLLVTTQNRPLAIRHTADVLEVPLLSTGEAYRLFHRICAVPRDDAVERILRIAQGQPLALTLAATQAAIVMHRAGGIRRLADDLAANAAAVLDEAADGTGVTSAALVAYRRLSRPLRRAFRAAGALADGPFRVDDVAVLLRLRALPFPLRRLLLAARSPLAMVGARPLVALGRRRLDATEARLASLTYLALVTVEGDRYSVHQVLRSWSRTRDRFRPFRAVFRQYCVAYADAHSGRTERSLIALEQQRQNLLAATREAYADRRWSDVVSLVRDLNLPEHPFLEARGLPQEEMETLTLGAEAARRRGDKLALADFTGNLAIRFATAGRFDEATEGYRTAEALYETLRKPSQVALARFHRARIAHNRGQYDEAERLYWSALRTIGSDRSDRSDTEESPYLEGLGRLVRRFRGAAASDRFRQQVGIDHERHNVGLEDQAYEYLGLLAERRGDLDTARQMFTSAAEHSVRNRRRSHQIRNLGHAARLALAAGERERAEEILETAVRHLSDVVHPVDYSLAAESAASLAASLGRLDQGQSLLRGGLRAVERYGGVRRAAAATALAQYLMEHYPDTGHEEAERLAREVLEFYDANPGPSNDVVACRYLLSTLRLNAQDLDGAYDELTTAAEVAREAQWHGDLLIVLQRLWSVEQSRGRLAHAATILRDCAQLAGQVGDSGGLAEARVCLAEIEIQRGRTQPAREALDEIGAVPDDPPSALGLRVLAVRVQLAFHGADLDEAAAHAEELSRQAAAVEDPAGRLLADDQHLTVASGRGDVAAALAALDRGDKAAADLPADPVTLAARAGSRAAVELSRTRLVAATAQLRRAERVGAENVSLRRWLTELAADADRAAGRWDAATEAYRELEGEYGQAGSEVGLVSVAVSLADIAVRGHDPASAIAHAQAARTLATRCGLRLSAIAGDLLLALAHQQLDDLSNARVHATTALAAARGCGSPFLLAQAHACMARQAVHERRFRLAATHLARLREAATATGLSALRATTLDTQGRLAHFRGDPATARTYHEASLLLCRRLGTVPEEVETLTRLAEAERALGEVGPAKKHYREALSRMDTLGAAADRWRKQVAGCLDAPR
ncbi:tetratricopeptide repeat protein [Phytohabitans suffuscus]|uniref:tetratricopeptide repeat protein n=1 Tax=Phytohabitans suffuscus TaxID=624315 RepID=UPI0015659C7E|nr:tetratricopeptide repeat protein [Phytohabitans suffuscus]